MGCEEVLREAERLLAEGETLRAAEKYVEGAECLDSQGEYEEAARAFLKAAEIYRGRGDYYSAANAFKDAMIRYLVSGKPEEALRIAEGVEEEVKASPTFAFALSMLEERVRAVEEAEGGREGVPGEVHFEEAEPLTGEDVARVVGGEVRVAASRSLRVEGAIGEGFLDRVLSDMRVSVDYKVAFTLTARSGGREVRAYMRGEFVPEEPRYYVAEVEAVNPWGVAVDDAALECMVPGYFEVVGVEGGSSEEEEVEGGVRLTVRLGGLAEEGMVKVRVRVARRMGRTIVLMGGGVLNAIQVFLPVVQGDEGLVASSDVRVPSGRWTLLLEDVIPLEYSIARMFPEADRTVVEGDDTIVRWRIGEVGEGERVRVGYVLEERPRALLFEREVRLRDGRLIARVLKAVEPVGGGRYVVQVTVRNLSREPLENVEVVDLVPRGHEVNVRNAETVDTGEGVMVVWRTPVIQGEGGVFEEAYWAKGDVLQHHEPARMKAEGFETVRVERTGVARYKGRIEGRRKEEVKREVEAV
nr:hypothetical protein [Candidatus Freyrarchaeum guaymaensis]